MCGKRDEIFWSRGRLSRVSSQRGDLVTRMRLLQTTQHRAGPQNRRVELSVPASGLTAQLACDVTAPTTLQQCNIAITRSEVPAPLICVDRRASRGQPAVHRELLATRVRAENHRDIPFGDSPTPLATMPRRHAKRRWSPISTISS
jgi:hypothetical protein